MAQVSSHLSWQSGSPRGFNEMNMAERQYDLDRQRGQR
jgi:hypothetical protein